VGLLDEYVQNHNGVGLQTDVLHDPSIINEDLRDLEPTEVDSIQPRPSAQIQWNCGLTAARGPPRLPTEGGQHEPAEAIVRRHVVCDDEDVDDSGPADGHPLNRFH